MWCVRYALAIPHNAGSQHNMPSPGTWRGTLQYDPITTRSIVSQHPSPFSGSTTVELVAAWQASQSNSAAGRSNATSSRATAAGPVGCHVLQHMHASSVIVCRARVWCTSASGCCCSWVRHCCCPNLVCRYQHRVSCRVARLPVQASTRPQHGTCSAVDGLAATLQTGPTDSGHLP